MSLQTAGARLVVEDFEVFGSKMSAAQQKVQQFGQGSQQAAETGAKSWLNFGNAVAAGLGFVTGQAITRGINEAIFGTIKAAGEAQEVFAQTEAVLKSTGRATDEWRTQVTGLADELSKFTKFDDEAILSAENLLLTFTSIGSDIFPQATEVVLDMSQALGQDLKSSAIQLGKALQDPVLGVTALRRVGVNFSEDQVNVIKSLVETGRAAEAQQLIMRELTTEFGGSARAAGETFPGKIAILKTALGNLQETVGQRAIPALSALATVAAKWAVDAIGPINGFFDVLGIGFDSIGALVTGKGFDVLYEQINKTFGPETGGMIGGFIESMIKPVQNLVEIFQIAFGTIKALITGVGFDVLYEQINKAFGPQVGATIGGIIDMFANLLHGGQQMGGELSNIFRTLGLIQSTWAKTVTDTFGQIAGLFLGFAPIVERAFGVVQAILESFFGFFGPKFGEAVAAVQGFVDSLQPNLTGAVANVFKFIAAHLEAFVGWWEQNWWAIQIALEGVWRMIEGVVQIAWGLVSGIIKTGLAVLAGDWDGAWKAIQEAVKTIWDGIGKVIGGAVEFVVGLILTFAADAVKAVRDAIPKFLEAGKNMIDGLIQGVLSALPGGIGTMTKVATDLTNAARNALQTHSPSEVFKDIGEDVIAGLVAGLVDKTPEAVGSMQTLVDGINVVMADFAQAQFMEDLKKQVKAASLEIAKALKEGLDPTDVVQRSIGVFQAYAQAIEAAAAGAKAAKAAMLGQVGVSVNQGGYGSASELLDQYMKDFKYKTDQENAAQAERRRQEVERQRMAVEVIRRGGDPSRIPGLGYNIQVTANYASSQTPQALMYDMQTLALEMGW